MLRHCTLHLVVKKVGVGAALGGAAAGTANKLQTDEKFALGALEYLYEANLPNDGVNKRAADVARERRVSEAYDRYMHVLDAEFDRRTDRLVYRMNEALEALAADAENTDGGDPAAAATAKRLLEEATLLNSEMPPLSFRLPKQTPPIAGFEPAFGFDVPQLRVSQLEERPTQRPTDMLQLQATVEAMEQQDQAALDASRRAERGGGDKDGDKDGEDGEQQQQQLEGYTVSNPYPFVDATDVRSVLRDTQDKLDELHGTMRSTVPLTGTSGEEWEAHCALQHRALARQQLILDLSENPELYEKFSSDDEFAALERERRGILPLDDEPVPAEFDVVAEKRRVLPLPLPEMHYAQSPKAHAFRQD